MVAVCGIGNPGPLYFRTRHNLGFLLVDYLRSFFSFADFGKKFSGDLSCGKVEKLSILLFKPGLFMNNSGPPVSQLLSFYKIPLSGLIVVHDDADLEFGRIKIKIGGSHGGHNGLRSIDQAVGPEYWRLRFGVGRCAKTNVSDYLLSKFSFGEYKKLEVIFHYIASNFISLVSDIEKLIPKFIENYKVFLYTKGIIEK